MRKLLAVLLVSMSISTGAIAQWAVIDASNLVQNIKTALSTYQTEMTQAQQLVNQYKQLEYEYAQLKSLPGDLTAGLMGTVQGALNNQTNYLSSVRSLYGDLSNAQSVATNLYNRMAASGLSQDDWMKREAERNRALQEGNGFLTDYQANVLSQVGNRYNEVRSLQSKITATEGTHEAMQLMNSQMNALLSTMNQLLEQNATLAQRSVTRDVAITGREKAVSDANSSWLEAQRASREAAKASIGSMGSGY